MCHIFINAKLEIYIIKISNSILLGKSGVLITTNLHNNYPTIVCLTQAWLTVFSSFLLQKLSVCYPILSNLLGVTSLCIYLHATLNSVKC